MKPRDFESTQAATIAPNLKELSRAVTDWCCLSDRDKMCPIRYGYYYDEMDASGTPFGRYLCGKEIECEGYFGKWKERINCVRYTRDTPNNGAPGEPYFELMGKDPVIGYPLTISDMKRLIKEGRLNDEIIIKE